MKNFWSKIVFSADKAAVHCCIVFLFFLIASVPCRGEVSSTSEVTAQAEGSDVAYEKMKKLAEVIIHVREHYVEEKDYDFIIDGALHGMLRSVDEYSGFLEPKAFEDLRMETEGKYSGIGIHVGVKDSILTVIAPIEGSPAFTAELHPGDRILKINGKDTLNMSLQDAVKLMRGKQGEAVNLTVQSQGEKKPRDLEIVRDNIEVPSVRGKKMLSDGIGYVRITTFSKTTPDHLQSALEKLQSENMRALILDLRSNPGGLLSSAVEVAQKFLKRGTLIVTTKGREGVHDSTELRAGGSFVLNELPLALLVNKGSASASEILAGALQANNRAILVGDTTFGKGSVQSIVPLRSAPDTAIRLTTAYYYTPDGRKIHKKGLEPDISIHVSPEKWRSIIAERSKFEAEPDLLDQKKHPVTNDPQLERATDILKAVMILESAVK